MNRLAEIVSLCLGTLLILLLALCAKSMAAPTLADPELRFRQSDGATRTLTLSAMREVCDEQVVTVDDPYHERRMTYSALPLTCVLDAGFAETGGAEGQQSQNLLLRALDGYTRPVSGKDLLEPGAFLAFAEGGRTDRAVTPSTFSRIDRRQVDPGPFYLVWIGASQSDPHVHPWPYQLVTIEVAPFATAFPRTVPTGLADADPGWAGYALFQRSCASCHAINGEGGKVGPDLNVPKSIVEYRPLAQIRAYIRDPEQTRYTSMPAHPDLAESQLDELIAYFFAMSVRKDDPRARAGS